jgi:hypothetical protein
MLNSPAADAISVQPMQIARHGHHVVVDHVRTGEKSDEQATPTCRLTIVSMGADPIAPHLVARISPQQTVTDESCR